MTTPADRDLAADVVRAARWSGHLPLEERRAALRFWLAERLAGKPRQQARRILEQLCASFEPNEEPEAPPAPPPRPAPPDRAAQRLIEFARRYEGDRWQPSGSAEADSERALELLGDLEARVAALTPDSSPGRGTRVALEELSARMSREELALRQAAQESFDRLFEAFSPAAIEAQVGRGGMKIGPFHKAGLYDAWCEKFDQLQSYHRAGRLVGDLRSQFRRHVKESEEREGRA